MRRLVLLAVVVVVGAGALVAYVVTRPEPPPPWLSCSGDTIGLALATGRDAPPPAVGLFRIANVDQPTDAAFRAGDDAAYVTLRGGSVIRVGPEGDVDTILEIEDVAVVAHGGLLSIAFDAEGEWLYLNSTAEDPDLVSRVRAFPMSAAGDAEDTGTIILGLSQPDGIHNVGKITFGPDGYLYVGSGDGGVPGGFEPDPRQDGQNLSTLYGGILRIEPLPDQGTYSVPDDNPFIEYEGARPELWVHGLRNPWRFSFDRANGDLWIGDVGHWCYEELNRTPFSAAAGTNYGWSAYEGPLRITDRQAEGHQAPLYAYRRTSEGTEGLARCSIIGGYVYRGNAIPDLVGAYVFADWCSGQIESLRIGEDGTLQVTPLLDTGLAIQSFAEGPFGELYVLEATGLSKLVPAGT